VVLRCVPGLAGRGRPVRLAAAEEARRMTSRERVIAALEHREPDLVPLDLGGTLAPSSRARPIAGCAASWACRRNSPWSRR
jgi:hypothetical protein